MSSDDVKRIIRDSVGGAGIPAPFAKLLSLPLEQPGRALSGEIPSRWERLIGACAKATGGKSALVSTIAASFELSISALDVLDEIEDDDYSPLVNAVGVPRAINITTALLAKSQIILESLSADRELPNSPIEFCSALNRAIISATIGQDEDLRSGRSGDLSLDASLEIARRKSGSLVAGAAVLGAMLGTADQALLGRFWDLGVHYGAMAQISNDIHDAHRSDIKSDTRLQKATLPLLFAERSTSESDEHLNEERIEETGALHFSWVVFEIERRRCLDIIEELRLDGQQVNDLISMIGE